MSTAAAAIILKLLKSLEKERERVAPSSCSPDLDDLLRLMLLLLLLFAGNGNGLLASLSCSSCSCTHAESSGRSPWR